VLWNATASTSSFFLRSSLLRASVDKIFAVGLLSCSTVGILLKFVAVLFRFDIRLVERFHVGVHALFLGVGDEDRCHPRRAESGLRLAS